ncbi:MAG: hypothetical protein K2X27_27210 [Candidatus Obscuribacterales bacterium]|nr:hypothetical protein [Candidatus Obscuribacterales bacterium]
MTRQSFRIWRCCLLLSGIAFLLTVAALQAQNPTPEELGIDYAPLIQAPDPELKGTIKLGKGGLKDRHEYSLTVFHADGKTPRVVKMLSKPEIYFPAKKWGVTTIYEFYRADGTLE